MELTEGVYLGTPQGIRVENTSTGTPRAVITMDVTHQPNADGTDWDDIEPVRDRFVYLYLSDAAFEYSRPKLEAVGFNNDFTDPAIGNQPVTVSLRYEEYRGRPRERWDIDLGSSVTPVEDTTLRRLNAKWQAGSKPQTPPPARRTPGPAAAGKEEAPF